MADEKKKLSTAEILAQLRAEAKGAAGASESESAAAEEPAAEAPAAPAETKPAAPAGGAAPTSTADILAAARAQAGGGAAKAEKPAAAPAAKPAAGGAKAAPTSTADILAAARAQATGGAAPAATGGAPAAKKPAAKKAAAKPAGELPPVSEMVKAVKGEVTKEQIAAKATPVRPPLPTRPPVAAKAAEPPRRNVLLALVATPFALAWTLFTLTVSGSVLAVARFMMPNVLVEPPSRFKVGPPSDYPYGTVSTKWKSQFGIWIVNTEYNGRKMLYALASVCTHLGCTPNWLEGEQKFKCPCHGSGFYINGINFEGPAPRPLERVGLALAPDGMLEVDKSVKFQEELGQWNDDASFVVV